MSSADLSETFRLSGVVDFDNLDDIRAQGTARIAAMSEAVTLSLGGLEQANSVTVALLIAWMRDANNQGISIVYIDVPHDLRNIIEFSGLTHVLPI